MRIIKIEYILRRVQRFFWLILRFLFCVIVALATKNIQLDHVLFTIFVL